MINFIDNSDEVLKNFEEQTKTGLELIGRKAEGYAKKDCPVDTGLLRNSLTWALSGESPAISSYKASNPKEGSEPASGEYSGTIGDKEEKAVYIGSNVKYAKKQEFGDEIEHTNGKAHFLRDAATTHNEEYKNIMEKVMKS